MQQSQAKLFSGEKTQKIKLQFDPIFQDHYEKDYSYFSQQANVQKTQKIQKCQNEGLKEALKPTSEDSQNQQNSIIANSISQINQNNQQKGNQTQGQNRKLKRTDNYGTSNMIRTLIKCMKDMLIGKSKQIFLMIQAFIKQWKIKSQTWSFIAILIYLVFLKDVQKCLSSQIYVGILSLASSKLNLQKTTHCKENKINNPQSDQLSVQYSYFIEHLELYNQSSITFGQACRKFNQERQDFFDRVIKKRQICIKEYLWKLKSIEEQLQESRSGRQ